MAWIIFGYRIKYTDKNRPLLFHILKEDNSAVLNHAGKKEGKMLIKGMNGGCLFINGNSDTYYESDMYYAHKYYHVRKFEKDKDLNICEKIQHPYPEDVLKFMEFVKNNLNEYLDSMEYGMWLVLDQTVDQNVDQKVEEKKEENKQNEEKEEEKEKGENKRNMKEKEKVETNEQKMGTEKYLNGLISWVTPNVSDWVNWIFDEGATEGAACAKGAGEGHRSATEGMVSDRMGSARHCSATKSDNEEEKSKQNVEENEETESLPRIQEENDNELPEIRKFTASYLKVGQKIMINNILYTIKSKKQERHGKYHTIIKLTCENEQNETFCFSPTSTDFI